MKYVAAETYGLCDFRRTTGKADTIEEAEALAKEVLALPPNPFYGFWGKDRPPIDPGEWLNVGDWMAVQDGMVSGPYKSARAAEIARKRSIREDVTDDPGAIGTVAKILNRHNGCRVTQAVIALR